MLLFCLAFFLLFFALFHLLGYSLSLFAIYLAAISFVCSISTSVEETRLFIMYMVLVHTLHLAKLCTSVDIAKIRSHAEDRRRSAL
jgi:hypothetical protein